jgi:hypothetical protein
MLSWQSLLASNRPADQRRVIGDEALAAWPEASQFPHASTLRKRCARARLRGMTATRHRSDTIVAALRRNVRGSVIDAQDRAYTSARRVWNAAIDEKPLAIVQCADAEDVPYALRVAADHGAPVTVRGGGHNVAGRAVRDGAVLIDLSGLRLVDVNPNARVATVQGGASWRDVDVATAAHGLATTGGFVSSTGVGGLTLGGGAGWLMRRYGLASDNLVAANIVLADGRALRASADEHPDLFWGLRGGAGGLGVVTSFEFHLHPLRNVLAGLVIHPGAAARDVLGHFAEFARAAPDEFCGLAALINAPALPFLDASSHGKPVLVLALCWCGDVAAGERVLAPLRREGSPLADVIGLMPYPMWQQTQDPSAPAGRFNYWKSANFSTLPSAVLELLARAHSELPTPFVELHLQHLGGAVARANADASAYPNREAQFFVNIIGAAVTAEELPCVREWTRALHSRLSSYSLFTAQPNFLDADDPGATRAFGPDRAARIDALRRKFAPPGFFVGIP